MIIWSGFGILVIPIAILGVVVSLIVTQLVGPTDYGRLHGWPMGVGLFGAATMCWLLGRRLRFWGSRKLVDPVSGEEVLVTRGRSLFFVPMEWWAIPLILIGLICCTMHSTPEQLQQADQERAMKRELKRQQKELNRAVRSG